MVRETTGAVPPESTSVAQLLEELHARRERVIALFREWDDNSGKVTPTQFGLIVQLVGLQVEFPASDEKRQAWRRPRAYPALPAA